MRIMKGMKLLARGIATIALTVGLYGCGQSVPTTTANEPVEAEQTTEVVEDVKTSEAKASDTVGPSDVVRPRTIVTTDLECDDVCALIHLLLYTNDIDLDGIVVTSSTYHWTGDGKHTQAEINDHTLDKEHTEEGNNLTAWRPMDLELLPKLIGEDYASV
jgi:hypothetical protein